MAGSPGIVWDKATRETLAKRVKRFNDKVRREAKKHPEAAEFLPKTKSMRQLRKEIKTKADLRQVQRDIDLIFKPGSLKLVTPYNNVVTTRYQQQVTKNAQRRVARSRQKEVKRLQQSPNYYGLTREQERFYSAPKFQGDTQSGWRAFVESMDRAGRASHMDEYKSIYHENFRKAVIKTFGEKVGSQLASLADRLPKTYLYDIYLDNPNLTIDFIYGADETELKANTIRDELLHAIDSLEGTRS